MRSKLSLMTHKIAAVEGSENTFFIQKKGEDNVVSVNTGIVDSARPRFPFFSFGAE